MTAGFINLIAVEILILIIFQQHPIRLLSGIKFLIDSVFDSNTQISWWKQISLNNLLETPSILIFLLVTCAYSVKIILNFFIKEKNRDEIQNQVLQLSCIFFIFQVLILFLQFFGKTVALNTAYFTTPILLVYFIFISLNSYPKYYLLFMPVLLYFAFQYSSTTLFILIMFIFVLFVIHLLFRPCSIRVLNWGASLLCISLLLFSISISGNGSIYKGTDKFAKNKECEILRLEFRKELINATKELDKYGKRGTLYMTADDFLFNKKISFECPGFKDTPLSHVILSLSAFGFPRGASLGPLDPSTPPLGNPGPFFDLARMMERPISKETCFINFVEQDTGKSIILLGFELNYDHKCRKLIT